MRRNSGKIVIGALVVAAVIYIANYEPQVIQGLARTGVRFGAVALGLVFILLAGRTLWAAAKGENDPDSAPVDNPGSFGNRFAGLFLASFQACIGVAALYFALFNFPY